ncbi:thiosulfate sulfurtransferase-like [Saccoglossus kowalevskii]|uniref:Sulfurtransferase n=1 Tax=Saccoglossus kowalevskii TaxID=10224 RepID=A0ABM0GI84_SACKO|nr:PREDICTED: thiosulfate sulfurtransferase-like [Saccoglossus kowalevskii]
MGCQGSKTTAKFSHQAENNEQTNTMTNKASDVPVFVSTEWLSEKMKDGGGGVCIVDVSWHMPQANRDPEAEYKDKHILGAHFLNLSDCKDKSSNLEMMLPSPDDFAKCVGALGIGNDSHVVVYDNNAKLGMFSAPRAWYMFRVFGHDKISILNGGFPKWVAEDRPTTSEVPDVDAVTYSPCFRANLVKDRADVESNMSENRYTLLDARPPGRFNGEDPEPVPNIKSGHVKGSVNIPFPKTLDGDSKLFKEPNQLKDIFSDAGIDLSQPLTVLCGTGLTASFLVLAAFSCGKLDVPIYDGAWMEWFLKSDPDTMEGVPE